MKEAAILATESSLEAELVALGAIFVESVSQLAICIHDKGALGCNRLTQWKTSDRSTLVGRSGP
jgi:hypothetical protein